VGTRGIFAGLAHTGKKKRSNKKYRSSSGKGGLGNRLGRKSTYERRLKD